MNTFISHASAAVYWKIPYIEKILRLNEDDFNLVHQTVSTRAKKYAKKGRRTHMCQMQLPRGGIIRREDILIASPELVFLELSSKISLHRLILLGLQLCSFPPGSPNKSISTKKKLQKFIEKTPGHTGSKNARRALKYIEDGSASLMESLTYMILCLPHALGGYGLGGAVFNHEVKLKKDAAHFLSQNRCFVDLYYRTEKIAVEYDSYSFHNSPEAQGRDAIRSEILHKMGFRMMHLQTIQLYNVKACDVFAINLSRHLGRRIRFRARQYEMMRDELRSLLPLKGNTI